jgi:hypothetical protein
MLPDRFSAGKLAPWQAVIPGIVQREQASQDGRHCLSFVCPAHATKPMPTVMTKQTDIFDGCEVQFRSGARGSIDCPGTTIP